MVFTGQGGAAGACRALASSLSRVPVGLCVSGQLGLAGQCVASGGHWVTTGVHDVGTGGHWV